MKKTLKRSPYVMVAVFAFGSMMAQADVISISEDMSSPVDTDVAYNTWYTYYTGSEPTTGWYTLGSDENGKTYFNGGVLQIDGVDRAGTRQASAAYIYNPATSIDTGNYTASFKVSNWIDGETPSTATNSFVVLAATLGADAANSVTVNYSSNVAQDEIRNNINGTGDWDRIGAGYLTAAGNVSVDFSVGTSYDFLLFGWTAATTDGTSDQFSIDDFSVVAIPEPSSLGLIGAVGVGLFAARRFMI